uniref:Uncharacterized protein LOC111111524 n=1 Tax=Crassostrea virginica TaxID=6565 RepID=A0A8B8BLQ7_CRAVI|nr:uncharacterized protein LOC111111524 [Crassostrea virginica]XP_022304257.1 uncharacterized protein LOC111111524 [Crassostrea virginica]
MQLVSVAAFLCLLDYSFRGVEANVPSPTVTRPQLQIVYNDKLRQAMKRFNITEADMSEMLTSYTESGTSPTITKSILNPETGLQETITLDFQGFAQEWSTPKPATPTNNATAAPTAAAKRAAVRVSAPVEDDVRGQLDTRDLERVEEQKRHLMRGMMVLDAESTDLTADFESGRITQHLYRQRMLDNRELYKALMTQLIKIQSILENYKTTNPGSARRDSSRVVSSPSNSTVTSSNVVPSQHQQVTPDSPQSLQADAAGIQERQRVLEELRQQNALLKLRLREEQERLSSAGQGVGASVRPGDSRLFRNTPVLISDSFQGAFRRQSPRRQSPSVQDNTLPVVQDPDIFVYPLVTAADEPMTEGSADGIITPQTFTSASSLLNTANGRRLDDTRESLLAEYQQLQSRKRVINQILRRSRVRV